MIQLASALLSWFMGMRCGGLLKIMKEKFLEPKEQGSLLQYVAVFKDRLNSACEVAHGKSLNKS